MSVFTAGTRVSMEGTTLNVSFSRTFLRRNGCMALLCRPKSNDANYEMCVLVHCATKKKWNTDTAELQRAKDMKSDLDIWKALKDPDLFTKGKGKSK